MGEMADYYREQEEMEFLHEQDYTPHYIWYTKGGKPIPIIHMSNYHLINVIKMLLRKNSIDALEAQCNQWEDLIKEADKRQLEWR